MEESIQRRSPLLVLAVNLPLYMQTPASTRIVSLCAQCHQILPAYASTYLLVTFSSNCHSAKANDIIYYKISFYNLRINLFILVGRTPKSYILCFQNKRRKISNYNSCMLWLIVHYNYNLPIFLKCTYIPSNNAKISRPLKIDLFNINYCFCLTLNNFISVLIEFL